MKVTRWDKVKWWYYARKAKSGSGAYAKEAAKAEWMLLRYCKEKGWELRPAWRLERNICGDEIAMKLAERVAELQYMHEMTSKIADKLSTK